MRYLIYERCSTNISTTDNCQIFAADHATGVRGGGEALVDWGDEGKIMHEFFVEEVGAWNEV